MECIIISCLCAIVITIIINRIVAIHYLNIIDNYKKDVTEMIKELIREANL